MEIKKPLPGKEHLPGVEGSTPIKPIPTSEEGQKAMAAEKGIYPYSEQAEWEEKLDAAKKSADEKGADPFIEEDDETKT